MDANSGHRASLASTKNALGSAVLQEPFGDGRLYLLTPPIFSCRTHTGRGEARYRLRLRTDLGQTRLQDLEHDLEKHALGLDPRVGTGFPSGQTRSVLPGDHAQTKR